MASFAYNAGLTGINDGTIDLDTDTFHARLVMTNTTCDTQNDGIVNVVTFTTLGTSDATGYADVALTTPTVTTNDASNRSDWDAASDVVFSGLSGDATTDYVGALVFKFITNDTSSLVVCYIDFTTDIPAAATQVTIPFSTTNILEFTATAAP